MNKPNDWSGRIKTGPKVALLAALLGCVSFASGGYSGEVIVRTPGVIVVAPVVPVPIYPVVVEPPRGFFLFGGGYDGRRDAHDYGRRGNDSRREAHPRDRDGDHDRGGKR